MKQTHTYTYLKVADSGFALASVTVAVLGGRGGGRQIVGRDAPCVPVCPVDTIRLHV